MPAGNLGAYAKSAFGSVKDFARGAQTRGSAFLGTAQSKGEAFLGGMSQMERYTAGGALAGAAVGGIGGMMSAGPRDSTFGRGLMGGAIGGALGAGAGYGAFRYGGLGTRGGAMGMAKAQARISGSGYPRLTSNAGFNRIKALTGPVVGPSQRFRGAGRSSRTGYGFTMR